MGFKIALAVGLALSFVLASALVAVAEEKKETEIVQLHATGEVGGGSALWIDKDEEFIIEVYVYIANATEGIANATEGKYQVNLTLSKDGGDIYDLLKEEYFTYNATDEKGYADKTLQIAGEDLGKYHAFFFNQKSKDASGTLEIEAQLYFVKDGNYTLLDKSKKYTVPIGKISGSCFGGLIIPLGILSIGLVCYKVDKKKGRGT
jgi:hypothetical protein